MEAEEQDNNKREKAYSEPRVLLYLPVKDHRIDAHETLLPNLRLNVIPGAHILELNCTDITLYTGKVRVLKLNL